MCAEWADKDAYLTQLVQLQSFNREADRIDASSGAHEAYLEYAPLGVTPLTLVYFDNSTIVYFDNSTLVYQSISSNRVSKLTLLK